MWTTTDGYALTLPRTVLRELASRSGASEAEIQNRVGRMVANAHRAGSLRMRKTGRMHPLFRPNSGPRSYDILTQPLRGTRSWPGPRGPSWPWAPTYGIVGVSSRFADPDLDLDDDPAVPDDDVPLGRPRARLAWRGPLPLVAATELAGGGIYIVEDGRGQPVYVGETASFARRLAHLARRFPGHYVRVARMAPPPDVLGAVGAAVARAVRGGRPARGSLGILPRDHDYGAARLVHPTPVRIERTVRTLATISRSGLQ